MSAILVETVNLLPALIAGLDEAAAAYLQDQAAQALAIMQGFTPVDTGELRDSEQIVPVDAHTVDITAGTDHAYAVHFGTERMPARPFIQWTADAMRESFQEGAAAIVPGLLG